MPRKKVNLPLIEVIVISLVLHLVALFVLGGFTVWKMVQQPEPDMEAPPVQQEAVKPQELKVRLQQTQKQTRQPTRVLQVQNMSQVNMPQLDINMPTVDTRVAVGGAGIGGGIGRGFGSGNLDIAKSAVNFFGIESSGENIVFVIDVTRSMLEPERGDVKGFNRVKEEIGKMVDGLNPGTLFNIYAYERGMDVFRPQPVPATTDNKKAAKAWVNQYWEFQGNKIVGKQGARSNNYRPTFTEDMGVRMNDIVMSGSGNDWEAKKVPLPQDKWGYGVNSSSRMELPLLAAFENYADTIFVITDGTPAIAREIGDKEFRDWVRYRKDWEKEHARVIKTKEWEEYLAARETYKKKVEAYQAERKRKGLPPEIREDNRIGGIPIPRPPDGWPRDVRWSNMSFAEMNKMLRDRAKTLYEKRDREPPSLNIVGYGVDKKAEDNLSELQKGFRDSRFRHLKSEELKEEKKDDKKNSIF